MKLYKKLYSILALCTTLALTGCIDVTEPESGYANSDQMASQGLSSALSGMNSQMTQWYLVYGEQTHETDMAYPQFMIAATEMMGDMYPMGNNTGYDWFFCYNSMGKGYYSGVGKNSDFSYLPWYTLYKFVKGANGAISTYKSLSEPTTADINYAAQAYGYRAFNYYMLMVYFEPVANIYTDCSKVLGLTVPIVTEETTEEQAKKNPRASHDDMVAFILSDLEKAEELFTETGYTSKDHTAPDMAVIKALKAKVYLWDEQYDKAYDNATEAIELATANGAANMTKDELTNSSTAFTAATSGWMWYTAYSADNMGNLCNFVGWMSGEASWGYSSLTCPAIDASLYNKMGINDYRRKQFLDPDRKRGDYQTCRDEEWLAAQPDYLALKFRCAGGNYTTYTAGGAIDVPIMRIEEMYLIQAEAAGMSKGIETGKQLLNSWVQANRDAAYKCSAETQRDFQLAVLDQMRIEFWGEGNAFPSAKRIKPGVMQYYTGTNAPSNEVWINAEGIKPNWNLVIPVSETSSNTGIGDDYNNPDPSACIDGSNAKIDEYAPGNF